MAEGKGMLIHVKLLTSFLSDELDYDYEKTKILATETVYDYDTYISFINKLKEYDKPLILKDEWYRIEDFGFKFPEDSTYTHVFYIYVSEWC